MTQASTTDEQRGAAGKASQISLGTRLRELRVARKLDKSEVAAELHLSVSMVEALEGEIVEAFPDPVFVRGYLRGYARVLATDPGPLIQAYEALDHGRSAEPLSVAKSLPIPRRNHLLFFKGTGVVGLVVAAVGSWWWFSQPREVSLGEPVNGTAVFAPLVGEASQTRGGPGESPGPDATVSGRLRPALPLAVAPLASAQDRASGPQMGDPIAREHTRRQAAASVTTVSEPEETVTTAAVAEKPIFEQELEATPEAQTRTGADVVGLAAEPADRASLALEFTADSWVQIHDVDGVRKLVGIIKADSKRVINGRPPFAVTLGNSEGVRVLVNGEPFDHTAYARGKVARFRVGGEAPETE